MYWTYLIHLGQNMWRGPKGDPYPMGKYSDVMVTEYDIWREIIDFLPAQGVNTLIIDLAEAVQYDSHPELACEGAWSKEKIRQELAYIRSLGITPIPKLNFSAHHDVWLKEYSFMVSTPTYYKVVGELIDEVCELFDRPEYFMIGMDEEAYDPDLPYFYIHMQKKTGYTCVRNGELFWHDIDYLIECCERNGVHPWIWGCIAWIQPEKCIERFPKNMMVSNALYRRMLNPKLLPDYSQAALKAYYLFAENGFKQVPTCMHEIPLNMDDTVYLLKDLPGIEGYMMAPWVRTRRRDLYTHKAAARLFGCAKEKYYPEER